MTGTPRPLAPELRAAAHALSEPFRERAVAFCRELVRIPSPSGDEEAAVRRTVQEMQALGLDDVEIDRAGNAIGVLRADADDRLDGAVMLNAHLDVVDVGDPARWPYPPFEGVLADGRLWGRGATDTKSAVAGQLQAVGLLQELSASTGRKRRRDVVVAAVVQEEVGGLGTAELLEDAPPLAAAVVGEPSNGALAFGHRGRVELRVTFHGRAAHASRPDWGANPHEALARFTPRLDELERDEDARFGRSSVAPTLVQARPDSVNVIPAELELVLDWRNVPAEDPKVIVQRVRALAEACALEGHGADVRVPSFDLSSWNGFERPVPRVSLPFSTDPEGALFQHCRRALEDGLQRDVPAVAWEFASDGGWLHAAGVPCIGYGPGETRVMHAANESVSTEALGESVLAYALLTLALDDQLPTDG